MGNPGLDALYSNDDRPRQRVPTAKFRRVLDRNPTHDGATYQLADGTGIGRGSLPRLAPCGRRSSSMAEQ